MAVPDRHSIKVSRAVAGGQSRSQITVPVDWAARHLDHGYTMTCQTAQGATQTIDSEQHLDRLAARVSVRRNQTLATRQLPRARPTPGGSTR